MTSDIRKSLKSLELLLHDRPHYLQFYLQVVQTAIGNGTFPISFQMDVTATDVLYTLGPQGRVFIPYILGCIRNPYNFRMSDLMLLVTLNGWTTRDETTQFYTTLRMLWWLSHGHPLPQGWELVLTFNNTVVFLKSGEGSLTA